MGESGGIDELEEVAWVLIKGGHFANESVLASFGDFHLVCDLMELCFLEESTLSTARSGLMRQDWRLG